MGTADWMLAIWQDEQGISRRHTGHDANADAQRDDKYCWTPSSRSGELSW